MNTRIKILSLLMIGFLLIPTKYKAQKFSKEEIKTAFVHNFVRFVSWPPDQKNITIGIIGIDEFSKVLKANLTNQKIGTMTIKIVQYSENENFNECDVLVISKLLDSNQKGLLDNLKGKNILSISERENFCEEGGIINFVEGANGNYFFEINQTQALQEKIQISSKLLRLAIKVK